MIAHMYVETPFFFSEFDIMEKTPEMPPLESALGADPKEIEPIESPNIP